MPSARIFRETGYEQTAFPVLARVVMNGSPIVQDDIDSITVSVRRFKRADGTVETTLDPADVDVSDAVFDTLQTNAGWDRDTTGYNFAYTVEADAFPGPDAYSIVFTFTPVVGEPFPFVVRCNMLSLQGAV